jgi:SAM-dependent methyltransferase
MEKKDYFSQQSETYAAFRPTYPEELYAFIFRHLKDRSCAWDCATGNGQVARYLADYFHSVYATDISQQQLDHAFAAKNISYSVAPAERTRFEDNQFDLITVAQALHWFDLPSFYKEANRTAKPGGLLAVWGYGLLSVDPLIDELFLDFYNHKTGPYWDPARRLVENHYRDIPFPFETLPCPGFNISVQWTPDQFAGYLQSWSATQKYIESHGMNPVTPFMDALLDVWGKDEMKRINFPVFMKAGIIRK